MKKTVKFLALALCPVLFAVACEKETQIVNNEEPAGVQSSRVITLVYPSDTDTKVSFAEDGKTAWEAGDEILIHGQKIGHSGDEYYSRVVTLSAGDISADGKTASFVLEDILADKSWGRTGYKANLFAAYPASAVKSVSDGTSWYYSTGFDTNDILLLGGCNDTSVNDGNTFQFTHLSGVLSFVVDGDFDSYEFSGNGGTEIVGYDVFSARVDQQSTFGDKNAIPYSGSGGGIGCSGAKTSLTNSVIADGSTVNHIFFPGGVDLSAGFTIKFLKGGVEQKRLATNTAKNIAKGKYLKLGDITSHLYTYVPPATHDASHPAIAGAVDLGATATANCYIVDASNAGNADKVFKFKAVKGNSDTNVGTISSVSILWETYNNNTDVTANSVISQVDFDKQEENDYYEICFQMPAALHAGNAVIAARDGSNNILWSWHIWVPETTITSNTYGIYSSALMDRYLGALVAATTTSVPVESFGLHYEWGRKDPFVGANTISSNSFAKVSGSTVTPGYEMTLAETIANPTTYAVYTEADSWGNWLSPSYDSTLWQDDVKTMYDPCPAGYRVPKYDSSQPLHSSDLSAVTGWSDNAAAGDNAAYFTLGSPVTVFPYCGLVCENGKYIDHLGARTFIWTAHASGSSGSGYMTDVRLNTSTHKSTNTVTSRGCSIRCVVDE
jgi:hypothetical protein